MQLTGVEGRFPISHCYSGLRYGWEMKMHVVRSNFKRKIEQKKPVASVHRLN